MQVLSVESSRSIMLKQLDFLMSSETYITHMELSEELGTKKMISLDPGKIVESLTSEARNPLPQSRIQKALSGRSTSMPAPRATEHALAHSRNEAEPLSPQSIEPQELVRRPPFHATSTSKPPRARSPVTDPAGHALGNAGRNSISPLWLCTSISAIAAAPPKFPSIWNGGWASNISG